jgi:hypothetical protein
MADFQQPCWDLIEPLTDPSSLAPENVSRIADGIDQATRNFA